MPEISQEIVEHVAALARIRLDEAARNRMASDMEQILDFMEQLNELDTSGVEPMMHVVDVVNVLRDDTSRPSLPRETALERAPATDGHYYLVPRILDSST